jgi:hypothetical protein
VRGPCGQGLRSRYRRTTATSASLRRFPNRCWPRPPTGR